jgi:hypothetical protein
MSASTLELADPGWGDRTVQPERLYRGGVCGRDIPGRLEKVRADDRGRTFARAAHPAVRDRLTR